MIGTLIYNDKTGDVKITQADKTGKKYTNYINNGYKVIGEISGFNVVVKGKTPE